jgi:hypothetical protein
VCLYESEILLTDLDLCFSFAEDEMTTRLAVVASILRLGTKYGVAYFRRIAVARLLQAVPTTLDQYAKLEKNANASFEGQSKKETMLAGLHLARECNVPALLPCCLWFWTPACGQLNREYLPGGEKSSFATEDGRVYALDLETYSLCLAAGWRLDGYRRRLIESAVTNCDYDDDSCMEDASPRLMDHLLRDREALTLQHRSFIYLFEKIDWAWWSFDFRLCQPCAERINALWNTGREESWDALPGYYELAPWEELLVASEPKSNS